MLLYSTFSYGNDKNLYTLIISFLNIIVKHKKLKLQLQLYITVTLVKGSKNALKTDNLMIIF